MMAEVTVIDKEPLERPLRKGDVIRFGRYYYGDYNDEDTPWAPMEWLVLRYERRRAFVVSRYGIDSGAFHFKHSYSLWRYSTLIQWLNSQFLFDAFSAIETAMIVQDEVITPPNPQYPPKAPWEDCAYPRLYLLSCEEAAEYFESNAFCSGKGIAGKGASGEDPGIFCQTPEMPVRLPRLRRRENRAHGGVLPVHVPPHCRSGPEI